MNAAPRFSRSFHFLNVTQLLGALNDNVFKLLVIYLLINVKGAGSANTILSLAGTIYVVPFLIFSSGAGVLADRISKRTIIVYAKILECLIALYGFTAVVFESEIGLYTALFFMATHSAIFGPSKMGIIIELVEPNMVPRANGRMTSFTYLAIILGTFLASFLTDITNKNFKIVSLFCVCVAVTGLIASLGIKKTPPQNSTKKINPFFLYEIYDSLKVGWKIPHLLPAIFGSAFFLYIGAFTQLNIIPFAMQSLGLSEVGGGYLFLAMAVGIAIGAFLAGQLSKGQVEPGISCTTGFFVAIFFMALYFFSWSLVTTVILLGLLGMFGGAFLIPLDSFIQVASPDEKRGQIIATSNYFFSFLGVFLAALSLFLFSEEFGMTAASGFFLIGLMTFLINAVLTGRLSAYFFPFFAKKILKRFRTLSISSHAPASSTIIILQSKSWWDAILLFSKLPNLHLLIPGHFCRNFPYINGFFDAIHLVPAELNTGKAQTKLFKMIKYHHAKNHTLCLFIRNHHDTATLNSYREAFARMHIPVTFAHGTKTRTLKHFLGIPWYKKQITLRFEG